MIRLLQRQCFIEHKPTSASEAAHQQRLLPVGYQFKLVSLQALHDGSLYCVLHHDAIGHVYPGPEVTINVPAARKRSFLILRTRFARGGEFARFSGLEEDQHFARASGRLHFAGGAVRRKRRGQGGGGTLEFRVAGLGNPSWKRPERGSQVDSFGKTRCGGCQPKGIGAR